MVQFKRKQHDVIMQILTHADSNQFHKIEDPDWTGYYELPSGVKLYFKYKSGHFNYNFK